MHEIMWMIPEPRKPSRQRPANEIKDIAVEADADTAANRALEGKEWPDHDR